MLLLGSPKVRFGILSKKYSWIEILILLPLTLFFVTQLFLSVSWRMEHDIPMIHYAAFLINEYNLVPYREVFSLVGPGVMLYHMFIGGIFGYGDLALRLVDITWLLLLLFTTSLILKPFGRQTAWAAIVLFGLTYLSFGKIMSLQRDFVGTLPVSAALLLATGSFIEKASLKSVLIGVLFGLSTTIKPHFCVGAPFVILFAAWRSYANASSDGGSGYPKYTIRFVLYALIGFTLPIIAVCVWLYMIGALPYFFDMFYNYLPLHVQMTFDLRMIHGFDRVIYTIKSYFEFGWEYVGVWPLLACLAAYGFFSKGNRSQNRPTVFLLALLTIVYSIYPAIAGQFWNYHYMPFIYFVIITAALIFSDDCRVFSSPAARNVKILIAIVTIALMIRPSDEFKLQIRGQGPIAPRTGWVDELAKTLKTLDIGPTDQVQPLDWAWGALHSMLIAKVPAATPFLSDYHFYHHLSNPYIQKLRKRFINALNASKPKYILDVYHAMKPRVRGEDTSNEFPELNLFIKQNYEQIIDQNGYRIFRLKRVQTRSPLHPIE